MPPRWKVMLLERPASCLLTLSISPRTCTRRLRHGQHPWAAPCTPVAEAG